MVLRFIRSHGAHSEIYRSACPERSRGRRPLWTWLRRQEEKE